MSTRADRRRERTSTKACDHLGTTPEYAMLRNMLFSHVETLEDAVYDYLRKDARKTMSNQADHFLEIKLSRRTCEKEKLQEILEAVQDRYHRELAVFVARVDAREKKIKVVAQEMLDYIRRCERRGKVLQWPPELSPVRSIERDDEDFDHDLLDDDVFAHMDAAAKAKEEEAEAKEGKRDDEEEQSVG